MHNDSERVPRCLILFSLWTPNRSENSLLWLEFYLNTLRSGLANCDKIIAINGTQDIDFVKQCHELPNCLNVVYVPENMQVNSDASGFQACLKEGIDKFKDYDVVLFLHMKGITKNFEHFEGFRWIFGKTFFEETALQSIADECKDVHLHTLFMHPPTIAKDVDLFENYVREHGICDRCFMLNATYTVYACSGKIVSDIIQRLPENFYSENLNDRFSRFFFEQEFPSLIASVGGSLKSWCNPQYNALLKRSFSYNYDLWHSTALTLNLWQKFNDDLSFRNHPVPMIFGEINKVSDLIIAFEI